MIDACIDKKPIITADAIKKLTEKYPHIFDKIVLSESSTNLVQN